MLHFQKQPFKQLQYREKNIVNKSTLWTIAYFGQIQLYF